MIAHVVTKAEEGEMFRKSSSETPAAAQSHSLSSEISSNCMQIEVTVVNAGGSRIWPQNIS